MNTFLVITYSSVSFLCLARAASAAPAQVNPPVPIVIDTDAGNDIDDAFAVALLLQSAEVDIRAVLTSRFDPDNRARLVGKILHAYGRADIPLASGAGDGIMTVQERRPTPQFEILTPEDKLPAADVGRGVPLLIETLLRSPTKITLVHLGPLTNLALALTADPHIKEKIERVVLQGGTFEMNRSEINIANDPIAAAIVFASGLPVTVVSDDVTRHVPLNPDKLDRIARVDHPATRLLIDLVSRWHTWRVGKDPVLHDALAAAVVYRPELCAFAEGLVSVETVGTYTRGMTRFTGKEALPERVPVTTRIARTVDSRAFTEMFMDRVAAPPRAR